MSRKVFHGTTIRIEQPLVNVGRDNLDFGRGFYVTDIRRQAQTWAGIKSRYQMDAAAIINCYEFDFEAAVSRFHYKKFEHYDREWLHFIVDCRNGKKVWSGYDIIEGGVANDRVIDTVEGFMAGQIDEAHAIGQLAQHQPNNQICILRQEVVDNYLRFLKAIEIKLG